MLIILDFEEHCSIQTSILKIKRPSNIKQRNDTQR